MQMHLLKEQLIQNRKHQTHMTFLFPYNTERDVLQKVWGAFFQNNESGWGPGATKTS